MVTPPAYMHGGLANQGRHRGLPLRPSFSLKCPDAVVVVGQVAHFNLTPEASLCRGFYLLPFVLSNGWRAQMETFGQIACSVEVIRRMETCGQNPCEVGRPRKNKNLRRARHRARKGIGSTSNHLLKCPWRASNPPLRNLVQQRNPPLPAIESFYKGCELRRIRIAMAEWTKEVHSALREFRCRKQYHGGAAYLNKTPTRPRLQHRRARPPSPW